MANSIEIGIKVDNSGAITAIEGLNQALETTAVETKAVSKESKSADKTMTEFGKKGFAAFNNVSKAANVFVEKGIKPVISGLNYMSNTTQSIMNSISESFSKVAITSGLMGNAFISSTASLGSLVFAVMAVSLKIKLIYTALFAVAKAFQMVRAVAVPIIASIVGGITKFSSVIIKLSGNFQAFITKFQMGLSQSNQSSSTLGTVFVNVMNAIQNSITRGLSSIVNLRAAFKTLGLQIEVVSYTISKLSAIFEGDKAAIDAWEAKIKGANASISKLKTGIKDFNANMAAKQPPTMFNNIGKGIDTLVSNKFPKLKASVTSTLSSAKKDLSATGAKVSSFVRDLYGIDTSLIQTAARIMNFTDKAKPAIGETVTFIAKNFKMLAAGALSLGAAVLYGFKAFKLADKADELDDFSARMNMSIQTIQTWDTILGLAGTSIQEFGPAIDQLSRKAEEGDEVFSRLGVSVKNVDGTFKNTEQIFNETMMSLAGIENQTQRSAMTLQVFGKQGGRLNGILAGGTGAMALMLDKYKEYNTITPQMTKEGAKWNDTMALMGKAFEKGSNKYLVMFLNRFNHFVDVLKNSKIERLLTGPMWAIGGAAIALTSVVLKLTEVLLLLGNSVDVVANGFNVMFAGIMKGVSLIPGVSANFKVLADEYLALSVAGAKASGTAFAENLKRVLELQKESTNALRDHGNNLTVVGDKQEKLKEVQDDGWASTFKNIRESVFKQTEAGELFILAEERAAAMKLAIQNNASQMALNILKKYYDDAEAEIRKRGPEAELARANTIMENENSWYKFRLDKQKDSVQKSMDLIDVAYADEYSKLLKQKDDMFLTEEAYQERVLELDRMAAEEKKNITIDSEKAIKEERKKNIEELALGTFGVLSDIAKMNNDKKMEEINTAADANKKKLDGQVMTDRRRATAEKEIEAKKMAEQKKIRQKMKAWSLTEIAINTAMGVSKAWAAFAATPPLAVAMSGLQLAVGVTQAAAVASQSFANSGVVGGFQGATNGPDTVQVNARPGEMFLNKTDQLNLMKTIKSGNVGGSSAPANITQGNIIIQGNASQSVIDQIRVENQKFSNIIKDTVQDLMYRKQLRFS